MDVILSLYKATSFFCKWPFKSIHVLNLFYTHWQRIPILNTWVKKVLIACFLTLGKKKLLRLDLVQFLNSVSIILLKFSFIYCGQELLQILWIWESLFWVTLSDTFNILTFSSSSQPMWALFPRFKINLIILFYIIWSFFFQILKLLYF